MKVFIVLFLLVGVNADNICDKLIYDGLKVMDDIRNNFDSFSFPSECVREVLCGPDRRKVCAEYSYYDIGYIRQKIPSPDTLLKVCSSKQLDTFYAVYIDLLKYIKNKGVIEGRSEVDFFEGYHQVECELSR